MSDSRTGGFEASFGDRRHYGAGGVWYGIAPEGRREVDEWMGREHLAHLVGRPGGWRGRRFRCEDSDEPQAYFGLYDVKEPNALQASAAEADAGQTEWTRRMVPHFHDLEGGLYVYTVSSGAACGGHVATVRFRPAPAIGNGVRAALEHVLLDDVGRQPRVASVHLLEPAADDPAMGDAKALPPSPCVLLVEAVESDGIDDAISALDRALSGGVAAEPARVQRWQLMYMLTRD